MNEPFRILIIDDEPLVLEPLRKFLESNGFMVITSTDGHEGLALFNEYKPIIVLTDIDMPKMTGLELLTEIKKNYPKHQVIMFSGAGSMQDIVSSLRCGACDYLMKPINFELLLHTVNNCIEKHQLLISQENYKATLEKEVAEKTQELVIILSATIKSLSKVTEIRDPYTSGHQERVTLLSIEISKSLKLGMEEIECIKIAGLMHDIGKISVPSEILTKPSRLSKNEFALIKEHSEAGYSIIRNIPFKDMLPCDVSEIVRQHHERIDGSGYPDGLKGNDILFASKIIAVSDVIESMSTHRPYRPALGLEMALNEINKNKDKLYDMNCANAALSVLKPFDNFNDFLESLKE